MECSCRSNTEAWECPRPEVKELTDPPELPNPERPVADLTEEERDAWCDWYARIEGDPPPGYAPPEERPIEGEYTSGVACLFNRGFCEFAIPKLSKAQCMANLSLSECESPIANLTGCAIDMFSNDCGPFDYSCFDYMAAPNCEGTIVGEVPTAFPSCDVRVQ